jgi:imidazolonepropionase-like amidohydrolase
MTRPSAPALAAGLVLLAARLSASPTPPAAPGRVILAPDRVLDGRGAVLEGARVEVAGESIVGVFTGATDETADERLELAGLTLLPGLVDTHVHIDWHFDADGRTHSDASDESEAERLAYALENAYRTVMGGVTTVQSLGAGIDLELREVLARGVLPGPRMLTSVESLFASSGNPEELAAAVRRLAGEGADVIKLFASASIRDGGTPTMSPEQLDAACGEARRLGLRTAVHAHGPESARRAVEAGCTSIEHGALLDRETLELLGRRGVYYDPNIDLVMRNYFENRERFLGIGNYTEEGFAKMRAAVPLALQAFRTALDVPGLKIVFGTDAVAGAHGRNVEELVYRIETGGQPVLDAVTSATSLAAESLGLGGRLGAVAPGLEADLIGVDGNPLEDPGALLRVVFVMRAGRVVRAPPAPRP